MSYVNCVGILKTWIKKGKKQSSKKFEVQRH